MKTKDPNLTKTPKENPIDNTSSDHDNADVATNSATSTQKGTTTFDKEVYDSEHVNPDDNKARQPDRRDQPGGSAFDDQAGERSTKTTQTPQSDVITDQNRYATLDNAQTRVLDEDSK